VPSPGLGVSLWITLAPTHGQTVDVPVERHVPNTFRLAVLITVKPGWVPVSAKGSPVTA
jgi:hypothetical protein